MKRKCFGVKKNISSCARDVNKFIGSGLKAKGYCGGAECFDAITADAVSKTRADREKAERKQHAQDKQRIKSIKTVCSEAQRDVNAMIRAVDIYLGYSCIATGAPISDAGHFYHAGSKYQISWLRFFHANIHGQGAKSNRYAGGGDALNYMEGIIKRYGHDYLNDLQEFKRATDCGQVPAPTREEVLAMAKWCRAMTKIYKNKTK